MAKKGFKITSPQIIKILEPEIDELLEDPFSVRLQAENSKKFKKHIPGIRKFFGFRITKNQVVNLLFNFAFREIENKGYFVFFNNQKEHK